MDFDFFLTPKGVETPARVLGTVAELARMRLWIRAVPWGHPKRARSSHFTSLSTHLSQHTLPLALPLLSPPPSALTSSQACGRPILWLSRAQYECNLC